jgi:hypothetical protein
MAVPEVLVAGRPLVDPRKAAKAVLMLGKRVLRQVVSFW